MRKALSVLPTLAVAVLLALVARAQSLPAPADSPTRHPFAIPYPAALAVPPTICPTTPGQAVTVTAILTGAPSFQIVQPASPASMVTMTAVFLVPGTAGANYNLLYALYDPSEPQSTALVGYPFHSAQGVSLTAGWVNRPFRRPVVLASVSGVAQSVTVTAAVFLSVGDPTGTSGVGYEPNAAGNVPVAVLYDPQGQPTPLPGPRAALAHNLCVADVADQDLRALQQVLRVTQTLPPPMTADVVQTFVAPVTATAEWVELAIANLPPTFPPLEVLIFDPGPLTVPPPGPIPPTATSAVLDAGPTVPLSVPAWVPTARLTQPALLQGGRTYWLVVKPQNQWSLGADGSGGGGDPLGQLFTRFVSTGSFTEDQTKDLSFRIIGRPVTISPTLTACTSPSLSSQPTATASVLAYPGKRITQHVAPVGSVTFTASVGPGTFVLAHGEQNENNSPTFGGYFSRPLSSEPDEDAPLLFLQNIPPSPPSTPGTFTGYTNRPVVTYTLASAHHQSGPGVVYAFEGRSPSQPLELYLDRASSVTFTASATEETGPGMWEPLQGAHPVLAHQVCVDPAPDATDLAAVQQIIRLCEPMSPTLTAEVVQTFQVPAMCRIEWIELAMPGSQGPAPDLQVSILDPGLVLPGSGPLPVTATSEVIVFGDGVPGAVPPIGSWRGTVRLTNRPLLAPGKTYWLTARTNNLWSLQATNVTATGHVDYPGGKLYTRATTTQAFAERTGQDLLFRLIGVPQILLGVAESPAPPRVMRVSAGPVPFARELEVSWRDGSGRTSVDIYDVQGRRVRRVKDAGPAVGGAWAWRGENDRGRRVASGVYFIKVAGGDGRTVVRRVVFAR